MGVYKEDIHSLFDQRLIALHYKNIESYDPTDYSDNKGARKSFEYFNEMNINGGYIWAEYSGQSDILIGRIKKGSQNINIVRHADGTPGAILKTLKIIDEKVLKPNESIRYKARRPRGGTLVRWNVVEPYIVRWIEQGEPIKSIENLTPDQQETVCAEYLRYASDDLKFLLMPVGRTLKDVDIYGMSEDEREIFAQVTNYDLDSPKCRDKMKKLVPYKQGDNLCVMFCHHTKSEIMDDVMVVPLSNVDSWLKSELEFINYLFRN